MAQGKFTQQEILSQPQAWEQALDVLRSAQQDIQRLHGVPARPRGIRQRTQRRRELEGHTDRRHVRQIEIRTNRLVESILGGTWEISANNGSVAGDWESIEGMAGVFAFLLEGNPEYFLVKTGNVADPDIRFFLFRNLADLAYAVLDLGLLDFNDILNVAGISHVTEFGYDGGGGPPPVPEPGTMMLLGSGLIGLAGWGRKRFGKHVA